MQSRSIWLVAFCGVLVLHLPDVTLARTESVFPSIPLVTELYESEVEMWSSDWNSGWGASYELGLNGAEGNATNFNLSTALKMTRTLESRISTLDLNYAQASNNNIVIRDFALFRARNEYLLGESRWSIFTEGMIEYDRFQAFDFRLTMATGLGYRFIDNETTTLKTRAGLGTSREFGGPNDEWKPELVLGLDFKHKLTDRQSLYLTNDLYPNWTDFGDFRMITDAGWQLLIDAETRTSLKVGVINRHDSTPQGQKANDLNYSVLLMWNTK